MLQQKSLEQQTVPREIQMEFYQHTRVQLQSLYKFMRYDDESLTILLSEAKRSLVDRLIEEFERWEKHLPPYQSHLIDLLNAQKFQPVKQFLKGRMSQEEFLAIEIKALEQRHETLQREEIVQTSFIFVYPHHILNLFLDFLDPYSLMMFQMTCREFSKMNCDILYKKFITILCDVHPTQLPAISPFESIKSYVNKDPHLYSADTINQVNDNPRQLVWSDIKYQQFLDATYSIPDLMKTHVTYKHCFERAPRINYCGIYAIKEKYMKISEPSVHHTFSPCQLVEYYRYLRFWPFGAVTMVVNTKKMNKDAIIKHFGQYHPQADVSKQRLVETEEDRINAKLIRGEFVLDKDWVIMKTFTQSTIFTFGFQIKQTQQGPSDLLFVHVAQMKMIGDNYRYDLKKGRQLKYFQYKHIREFRSTLPNLTQGWNQVVY